MRHHAVLCVTAAALICACATSTHPGPLSPWDYETNARSDRGSGELLELAMGNIMGKARRENGAAAGAVSGFDAIALSPGDLRNLFLAAFQSGRSGTLLNRSTLDRAPPRSAASMRWAIADANEGQITTDWRPVTGRTAGVAWWKKDYQARVRHIITVKHSFRSPASSNYTIETQVEERPNDAYDWEPANVEYGRESFEEIKEFLLNVLKTTENAKGKK